MPRKGENKINKEKFKAITTQYLEECLKKNKRPLRVELALLLDITKDTLTDYSKREGYSDIIKRLDNQAEVYLNRKLDDSSSNQNAMFALKAIHGYIEAQHTKMDIKLTGQALQVVQLPQKKA